MPRALTEADNGDSVAAMDTLGGSVVGPRARPFRCRAIMLALTVTVAAGVAALAGCAASPEPRQPRVHWRNPAFPGNEAEAGRSRPPSQAALPIDVIATVNGAPIDRRELLDLLLSSHGVSALEQLIGLETARALARERGISLTQESVRREREATLVKLMNPLAAISPGATDWQRAERLLEAVIRERNLSMKEFDLVLERNTCLRGIVASQLEFTEKDLREEFERAFGERVRIRHIQLATRRELLRAREALDRGDGFADVARRYSANEATAARGGLLEPFSAVDDRIPPPFREAAFGLSVGGVSEPIRIGSWFQILKLEERIPATSPELDSVRDELERRWRDRRSESAMSDLYENLFDAATIEIVDPILREAFRKEHPDREN